VRPGSAAASTFDQLLTVCEALAVTQSLARLEAGVNTARRETYRRMLERGFRSNVLGLAMDRPDEPGYNRPDVYVSTIGGNGRQATCQRTG
jgi:hypothetical protein